MADSYTCTSAAFRRLLVVAQLLLVGVFGTGGLVGYALASRPTADASAAPVVPAPGDAWDPGAFFGPGGGPSADPDVFPDGPDPDPSPKKPDTPPDPTDYPDPAAPAEGWVLVNDGRWVRYKWGYVRPDGYFVETRATPEPATDPACTGPSCRASSTTYRRGLFGRR